MRVIKENEFKQIKSSITIFDGTYVDKKVVREIVCKAYKISRSTFERIYKYKDYGEYKQEVKKLAKKKETPNAIRNEELPKETFYEKSIIEYLKDIDSKINALQSHIEQLIKNTDKSLYQKPKLLYRNMFK